VEEQTKPPLPFSDMVDHEPEPTQPTQPKKGKPVKIPVPKVSTIRAAIRKVAQPIEPEPAPERDREE
jgi:hypothetical protein